jgi:hypothetical protein
MTWSRAANLRLDREGKKFSQRDTIYIGFHDHVRTVYRSAEVPRDVFTLIDPPAGLVLEFIEADAAESRDACAEWMSNTYLPSRITSNSPATSAMVFTPRPPEPHHDDYRREQLDRLSNSGRRVAVLWFLDVDPRECWNDFFTTEDRRVAESGLGEVGLVAPFIPSRMGTTLHEDQLR